MPTETASSNKTWNLRGDLIKPLPSQEEFLNAMYTTEYLLFGGSAGPGKMLRCDEPIPTPNGWMKMGELRIGDSLFDENGIPAKVIAVTDVDPFPDSLKLTFDDGSEIEACSGHQWLTFNAVELGALTRRCDSWRVARRNRRPSRVTGHRSADFTKYLTERNRLNPPPILDPPSGTVRTTLEIFQTLKTKSGRSNHAIPVARPLSLPEADLPIDPYLLGVWLGDGGSDAASVTSMDAEIMESFRSLGYQIGFVHQKRGSKARAFYVKGLLTQLRSVGVLKNKHIPAQYLRASLGQRLALLQGLMDTDGT